MTAWERLGAVPRARLVAARLQLHHAAQPAAAVGKLLLPHQEDYGEQSFRWEASARCLAQGTVAAATPFRAALRPAPPALLLLSAQGVQRELPLDGRTLDEVYGWLASRLEELLGRPLPGELERPAGLPGHPVAAGGCFDLGDDEALAELARLFGNADRVLEAWASTWPGASAVRCWPHHFDVATLASLTPAISMDPMISTMEADEPMPVAPEAGRTIGLGMVPGDEERPEPYFYVTPWPCPEGRELPPLPGGATWNTGTWVGAVLAAPGFMDPHQGAAAQAETAERFLRSAADACHRLLAPVAG
ncbi:MAG TPA: DUF5996 family protein [Thermoanaerobaculia bacterium]